MRRERVTEEVILAAMRETGLAGPDEVDAVVIETEGSLSIFSKSRATRDELDRSGVDIN